MPSQLKRAIWKFTVEPWQLGMKIPEGARLTHVHEQNGEICFWAEVDQDAPLVARRITAAPTGASITPEAKYVGTAHLEGLVFHVYDGGEFDAAG